MTKSRRDRLMNGSASVVLPRDVVRSAIEKAEAQGLINVDWSNPDRPRITPIGGGLQHLVAAPIKRSRFSPACAVLRSAFNAPEPPEMPPWIADTLTQPRWHRAKSKAKTSYI
ncbi:MAG TPA: hypothetical protein VNC42_15260 [Bradyrhizobium sp.]|nr:hypothetical protein [Bradyrhizobium sp.]